MSFQCSGLPANAIQGADTSWKIILVDDDADVHSTTPLSLEHLTFAGKPLIFVSADCAEEARQLIATNPDTAAILLDGKLGTTAASLQLVEEIRERLNNQLVRIIFIADRLEEYPDISVIINSDIHDCLTKVELTREKLAIAILGALKSYKNLKDIAELRQQLEQLETRDRASSDELFRESHEQFKRILEIADDAIISVDETQKIQLFNRGAEKIFGYKAAEILGQPLDILLPEIFRKTHRQHFRKFADSDGVSRQMAEPSSQVLGRRKNGEEFPAEASISKLEIRDRLVFTVILRDRTERQQIEAELRDSRQKFKGILEIADDAIISVDETQRIQHFNQGAEKIFGYKAAEVLDRPLDILLPEAFRKIHRQHLRNFADSNGISRQMAERSSTVFGRRKNGEEFPAEASISKLKIKEGFLFTVMLRDISERQQIERALQTSYNQLEMRVQERTAELQTTNDILLAEIGERQHAEAELLQSEEKFRQLTENIREVFYIHELASYDLVYVSPAFAQTWGVPCEILYQNPQAWMEAIHPEDRDRISQKLQTETDKSNFSQEFRIVRPDGEIRWIYSRSFPVRDRNGTIYRLAGIAEDITDRKLAETALKMLNQNLEAIVEHRTAQLANVVEQLQQGIRDRQRAEEELQQIRERLEFILANSGAVLYSCQASGNFSTTFVSEGVQLLTGYPPEEFTSNDNFWLDLIHPEDRDKILANLPQLFETGFHLHEYRFQCSDGRYIWVQDRLQLIEDATGNPIECIGYWLDITERKRAEETLERQFQRAVLIKQITTEIRQSLDSQKIFQTTATNVGRAFQVNRCLIHAYILKPAPNVPIVAEYLRGKFLSMLGMEIPIQGNPHIQQLLGEDRAIASDDVNANPLLRAVAPICRRVQLKSMLAIGTFYAGEPNGIINLHQCDRYRHWTEDEIELIAAVASQVGIALAHASLLEQEKQQRQELATQNLALEKATRAAEDANQAKSEFLANMSHEIRTPMNAILGFCNLLKNSIDEPRQASYLQSIAASSKILLALIDDILDLSKIEAGKLQLHCEPVNLRVLVEEICQIFSQKASEKGLRLQTEMAENIPTAIFDSVRLRQILFNVVGNALKFTERGSIEIGVQICSHRLCHLEDNKACLELIVADTGIGIAPNQQQRIFEAFVQTEGQSTRKYGGTGLGLAITKRLTHMLGGTIALESELGKGSTFSFVFPNVEIAPFAPLPTTESELDEDLQQFPELTVLVVDDVPSNRDLLEGYFVGSSHRLLFAADGLEAIAQARNHRPNIILLDLRMPNMDGREAAQHLKQDWTTRDIPIVILTASSLQQDREQLQQLCEGFIRKPVSRTQLVSEFKKILSPARNYPTAGPDELPTIVPPNIAPASAEKLPELLEKLRQEEETAWQQLSQTMKMRDLRAFARRLQEWGMTYRCCQLLDYARCLQAQLEAFDWERLPQTIEAFPRVRRSLFESSYDVQ